jgi:hypothetical protein
MPKSKTRAIRVKISVTRDKRLCKECELNLKNARLGRKFKLPPLHPHCRCHDDLAELLAI